MKIDPQRPGNAPLAAVDTGAPPVPGLNYMRRREYPALHFKRLRRLVAGIIVAAFLFSVVAEFCQQRGLALAGLGMLMAAGVARLLLTFIAAKAKLRLMTDVDYDREYSETRRGAALLPHQEIAIIESAADRHKI